MKKLLLVAALGAFFSSNAQSIPNGGFESWTNMGSYETPASWDNLNSYSAAFSVYTCTKGTPGNPGSSYMKLVSKTTAVGVAPGVAVSGQIDLSNPASPKLKSGFPYTSRPAYLIGNWQYMAYGADQGSITILLTKWNTTASKRDTIGYRKYMLQGMVMSWGKFSIPITYQMAGNPDSAAIVLSASGTTPVNNSYLYVDNLDFSNFPNSTQSVENLGFETYPNPTNGLITVKSNNASDRTVVNVLDISGKVILNTSFKNSSEVIDLSTFNEGVYFIQLSNGEAVETKKIILTK